jgi:hypothetical protein
MDTEAQRARRRAGSIFVNVPEQGGDTLTRFGRIVFGALVVLSIAVVAGAGPVTTDLFTVNLPDAYAAPVQSSATQNGIATSTWIAKAPTGEAVVISVSTMPAKIADPAKLIDSTRDSLLKSVKGTLDSEQPLTGDMPARDLLFRSGTAFLRSRLIVNGDRLYQLLYVGRTQPERDAPGVGQMFDSFKVTAGAVAAPAPAPVPPPPPATATH